MSHSSKVIVLIDMDCFYCQVEEKLDPNLQGKPIAVVQYNAWRGGGIIAVNYPARDQGVTRHMRGDEAKQKCPDIILARVPNIRGKADLSKYRDAGKSVADVLQTFTQLLERASVDEAYLDITKEVDKRLQKGTGDIVIQNMLNTFIVGYETADFIENIQQNTDLIESDVKLAMGAVITEEIRAEVFKQTGYKCSAGVAHNKILAKLVCGLHKPNKQTVLPHSSVPELYKDLPVKKIKSLGGKFGETITDQLQISFMGELIQFSEKQLAKKFDEKTTKWLYNIARGIDLEPVTTRLISKSIGCCKKFPGQTALKTSEDVEHWLHELCEEISERLEKDLEENHRKAKQMVVSFTQKVDKEFVNSSRNHPLNSYEKEKIAQGAMDVIRRFCMKADRTYHLTFLGVSIGNFQPLNNNKNITSFFKNMRNESNKSKEETVVKVSENIEANELTESVGDANKEIINENVKTKTKNSFFERFLKENSEFSGPSKNAAVNESKNLNQDNMENENCTIAEKSKSDKPIKKTNSFFERFLRENPEFANSDSKENKIVNQCNENEIMENVNSNEKFDDVDEENSSVYSASTEELNEDTKQLIYFEDVFSEVDSTKPIFKNSEKDEEKPTTSNNVCDNDRFAKSFFLNYLKTEGLLNTETSVSNENKNERSEDNQIEVNLVEDLSSLPIEQEHEICIAGPSTSADYDNQICPECNKKISNFDFLSHMDYHFALKLVKDEAHLYKNTENTNKKVTTTKTDKKSSTKRKKVSDSTSKSIVTFLQNPENDINDDDSEMCSECNKKIKLEDVSSHMDYHTAKRLHLELNSNLQNSKKNVIPISIKNKKNRQINSGRPISAFFKSDN